MEIFFSSCEMFVICLIQNERHRSAFLLTRPGKLAPTFPAFLFQLFHLSLKLYRPVWFALVGPQNLQKIHQVLGSPSGEDEQRFTSEQFPGVEAALTVITDRIIIMTSTYR